MDEDFYSSGDEFVGSVDNESDGRSGSDDSDADVDMTPLDCQDPSPYDTHHEEFALSPVRIDLTLNSSMA